MGPVNPVHENQNAPHVAHRPSEKPEDAKPNGVGPSLAQSHPAEAQQGSAGTPQRDWWDDYKRWVELAGVILLAVYTGFTIAMYFANKRSADAATHTAAIAARQLELSERPWVDAQISLNGPLTYNVNGPVIPLRIVLRNSGHSPAFATNIHPFPALGFRRDAAEYRDRVCQDASRTARQWPGFGITLFPGTNFVQDENIQVGKEDIERNNRETPGHILGVSAVICIGYRPAFNSSSVYTTSYIVDLYRLDAARRPGIVFKIGENVDSEHLSLRLHPVQAVVGN
jgi:hypothetical protein